MSVFYLLRCLVFANFLPPLLALGNSAEVGDHDLRGLFHFASRPEIRAPKWNVKIHNDTAVSPGYWFVGPYEILEQPPNSGHGWIGPHIYDGNGDLIWSGSLMFNDRNVEDFRISDVQGEELMTLVHQDKATGILLDDTFAQRKSVRLATSSVLMNTHEFHFVDNGTRAIASTKKQLTASQEESALVGLKGGRQCEVMYDGFTEYDTATWKKTFQWDSLGHVDLTESTFKDNIDDLCVYGWDYFHINSIDKTSDGHYWISGRHTDTLYKVNGKTGNLIYRLGGHGRSNFKLEEGVKFSRQHDIRIREERKDHTIISILDNARAMYDHQEPTANLSRGLILSLDTTDGNNVVSLIQEIPHPYGGGFFAPRRGNYHFLDSGNAFIGWSERALHTEHTSDGTLVMEAEFAVDWLGTYRNYKFPFVGRPSEPPAVYSAAYDAGDNTTSTKIHVSWNGATEVAAWNLYKTTKTGDKAVFIASVARFGFETAFEYKGYAAYVLVEALGKDGTVLGSSDIQPTRPPSNLYAVDVLDEFEWLRNGVDEAVGENAYIKVEKQSDRSAGLLQNPVITFAMGFACSMATMLGLWLAKYRGFTVMGRRFRYAGANHEPLLGIGLIEADGRQQGLPGRGLPAIGTHKTMSWSSSVG